MIFLLFKPFKLIYKFKQKENLHKVKQNNAKTLIVKYINQEIYLKNHF